MDVYSIDTQVRDEWCIANENTEHDRAILMLICGTYLLYSTLHSIIR